MNQFFQQLSRRNVIKAAISYVVISWAILQAADIIFPLLGIGDEVLRVVLVVLVVGFPIWVVFAYFFEWTPSGFKRTDQVAEETSVYRTTSKRLNQFIIGGLSMAVVLLLVDRFTNFSGTLPAETKREKSIAILPFDNLGNEESAYFARGVTEDILTQVSKIGDLRVLSRFTLNDYSTEGKTVEQIGEELGVSYLLTGSIRQAKDQIRISCQLIQVNPEEQTWADNYDRRIDDVFAIQNEVALTVAKELQSNLTDSEKGRINARPTDKIEAYNIYIRGREAYYEYKPEPMLQAVDLFKRAIEIDPEFALAYAGLADAYAQCTDYGVLPASYQDSALAKGRTALSLNSELSEAWKAIGLVHNLRGNRRLAKESYEKALEYNPNYAPAIANLVAISGMLGDFNGAMTYAGKAIQVDPTNALSYSMVTQGLYFIDMIDSTKVLTQKALKIDPRSIPNLSRYASCFYFEGNQKKGREMLEKLIHVDTSALFLKESAITTALTFDVAQARKYVNQLKDPSPEEGYALFHSAIAYFLIEEGKTDSAQIWIDKGMSTHEKRLENGLNMSVAIDYAKLKTLNNQPEESLEIIEKLIDAGFVDYKQLAGDVRFKKLRNDPTFQKVIKDLKAQTTQWRLEFTAGELGNN